MTASGCILLLLFWLLAAGSGLVAATTGNYAYAVGGLALMAVGWLAGSMANRAVNARRVVYDRWHHDTVMTVTRMEHAATDAWACGPQTPAAWREYVRELKRAARLAEGLEDYRPLYWDLVADGTIEEG